MDFLKLPIEHWGTVHHTDSLTKIQALLHVFLRQIQVLILKRLCAWQLQGRADEYILEISSCGLLTVTEEDKQIP